MTDDADGTGAVEPAENAAAVAKLEDVISSRARRRCPSAILLHGGVPRARRSTWRYDQNPSHQAGLKRGTATSTSTAIGTTLVGQAHAVRFALIARLHTQC